MDEITLNCSDYEVVLYDEFNGNSLNQNIWQTHYWNVDHDMARIHIPCEEQIYLEENVRVENGKCKLTGFVYNNHFYTFPLDCYHYYENSDKMFVVEDSDSSITTIDYNENEVTDNGLSKELSIGKNSSVIISPNPFNDRFIIDLSKSLKVANEIIITNLNGKIIQKFDKNNINKLNIISNISVSGIYFASIIYSDGVESYKIIKL